MSRLQAVRAKGSADFHTLILQGREGVLNLPDDSANALLIYAPAWQHRPKTLADIVGNVETIERLKVIARDGNCPHIIISVSELP